jgi:hypothetical protein
VLDIDASIKPLYGHQQGAGIDYDQQAYAPQRTSDRLTGSRQRSGVLR